MKYMGHKGKLLSILGDVLKEEAKGSQKIADPFCGSGAVSWFLAQNTDKIIVSGDLQSFAVARSASVVERTTGCNTDKMLQAWFGRAKKKVDLVASQFPNAIKSINPIPEKSEKIRLSVTRSRRFCESVLPPLLRDLGGQFPISLAYGGHYFSPLQAIELDALRQSIPKAPDDAKIAMAALVEAASRCAAAPGHTAQPFQPTETAAKFIIEAWSKNVWDIVTKATRAIAVQFAQERGQTLVGDYIDCIDHLQPGDTVFADPPYSDVHYSRFYHVLETLCRGVETPVSGVGRYPPPEDRPVSSFSRRGKSAAAALSLIDACANRELRLVLTFPTHGASNGLEISDFIDAAKGKFDRIKTREIASTFSTLGGNSINRSGRTSYAESIVCFSP